MLNLAWNRRRQRLGTPFLAALALLLSGPAARLAAAAEGILIAVDPPVLRWQVSGAVGWPLPQRLLVEPEGLELIAVAVRDQRVTTRLPAQVSTSLRLGSRRELQALGTADEPPAAARPSTGAAGVITRIDDDFCWVDASRQPAAGETASVVRDGRVIASLRWLNEVEPPRIWRTELLPGGAERPRLGDQVSFSAGTPTAVAALPTPVVGGAEPIRPAADEAVVPGDDPVYGVFSALASRGYILNASSRQFAGEPVAVYTEAQLVDFLQPALDRLVTSTELWPIRPLKGDDVNRLRWLIHRFEPELRRRGTDLGAVEVELAQRNPSHTLLGGAGQFDLTLRAGGGDTVGGRVTASLQTQLGERARFGLTAGLASADVFDPPLDRSNLLAWWAEYDLSRHASLSLGRVASRIGPGLSSLFWSDHAKPLDQLEFTWRTKLFGEPFTLLQRHGTYHDSVDDITKYVAVRRYQYQPSSRVTLAANFGLVTDRFGQWAGSAVIPLYFARFLAGSRDTGGGGNYIGSVDAAYRLDRQWAFYGELLVDDFDFSSEPPQVPQKVGWLGGVHFTPRRALPGTSYRLEAAVLPDLGTYVQQQEPALRWDRDRVLFGHEYGQDAAGVRFLGRHRLSSRFDVTLGLERFEQFHDTPVSEQSTRLDLAFRYDLSDSLAIGTGVQFREHTNLGGIVDNDLRETSVFVETRGGF